VCVASFREPQAADNASALRTLFTADKIVDVDRLQAIKFQLSERRSAKADVRVNSRAISRKMRVTSCKYRCTAATNAVSDTGAAAERV